MYNHCATGSAAKRKAQRLLTAPVLTENFAPEKSTRINQADEAYLHLFHDRVMPIVEQRALDENLKVPYVNLMRRVARECFQAEDEETRAAVAAELALQMEQKNQELDAKKQPRSTHIHRKISKSTCKLYTQSRCDI